MNATRFSTLFAAAAAMFSMTAGSAQAQGLFGGYSQSYPVYSAPSTPCATGNCGVKGYTSHYGQTPCATGNCPTSSYTTGYPTSNYPTANFPSASCPNGNCSTGQCKTICGPNGCQTICPTGGMQCGPNGCVPAVGDGNTNYGNVNYGPTTSAVPSLNLDQVSGWNNNYGGSTAPNFNMNGGFNGNTGFNGGSNFGSIAPPRNFNRPNFSGMNGGFVPTGFETNISNDPMVRLN